MDFINEILESQSPFRWTPTIQDENLHEFDFEQEDDGYFSFMNFSARILRIYDEYVSKSKTLGIELLNDAEKKLLELENSSDELYMKSKDALFHVFYACKALIAAHERKNDDEVRKCMKQVKKFDGMSSSNKAAIFAIKAYAYSLYSNDGLDDALTQIRMALSYDETTAYWSFLKGVLLQKQRSINDVPTLQEKEAFELAYKTDKSNPLYMVHFADTLRETCAYSSKRQKSYLWFVAKSAQVNVQSEMEKKNEIAFDLYRKCYELRPNCPVIAYKSANGLMRLPGKYQEVKLIKKIISESEKKFPNSGFGNLVCAFYHQRINKKIDLAQRCLEKCVELNIFIGCMNLIRLTFTENKEDTNIIQKLEKMLAVFRETAKQELIISQIVSYYVFVTEDIEKACEYMLKYYRTKGSGRHLEVHQSCFKMTDGPISLVNVITDEVKRLLKNPKLPKEKRKFYADFVSQMNFHNVAVLKGPPKNLLQEIKKSAVPKGKHPPKANLMEESQQNSSPQPNRFRQSNERAKYAPKNGDAERRREDAPRDRRGFQRNAGADNASRKDGNDERRDDRRFRGRNSSAENASRNNADARRFDDRHQGYGRADYRPASSDERPDRRYGGRASNIENVSRNDAAAKRQYDRSRVDPRPASSKDKPQPLTLSASSSSRNTYAQSADDDNYKMLMDICREGSRSDRDVLSEKFKELSLKGANETRSKVGHTVPSSNDATHSRSEVRRTVPEEFDREQASNFADESRDVPVPKERSRRSEDRSLEDRRRDRSKSKDSDHYRRHKHRKHKKKHRHSSESDDERRHRRSASSSRRHRRRSVDRHDRKSHRKHRSSESPADVDRSVERHAKKSHRRHRSSESASNVDRSVERHAKKSHRKHRSQLSDSGSAVVDSREHEKKSRKHEKKSRREHPSESASESVRSTDRKREKEKRSHHRSKKKHSSTERHHERERSHRDHEKSEKSSRRKKESKKRYSDSEGDDSR